MKKISESYTLSFRIIQKSLLHFVILVSQKKKFISLKTVWQVLQENSLFIFLDG